MSEHDWEWGYNQGVKIEGDHILWYEAIGACAFASGAACEQTFEHFLAHGPWYDKAPPEIVAALTRVVHEQVDAITAASRKPAVKTDASAAPTPTTKQKAPPRSA